MNFAIIGCGLIGQKRYKAIKALGHNVVCLCDKDQEKTKQIDSSIKWIQDIIQIQVMPEVEAVIVSTPNNLLVPLTLEMIKYKKHVLVEKPGAMNVNGIENMITFLKGYPNIQVQVGFNHRYHPAFIKAKQAVFDIQPIMFIRGRYGHGGRLGYNKEWRAIPEISGGGELIDQGVHLIDLAHWFLGDFTKVDGSIHNYFWDMKVEDNVFMKLETPAKEVAWLHCSSTEWKNTFSFEIYGKYGKIHIEGLGGSYGVERISVYSMSPQMGPPDTIIHEYPMEDKSWEREIINFVQNINNRKSGFGTVSDNLQDTYKTLSIVEKIYKQNGK